MAILLADGFEAGTPVNSGRWTSNGSTCAGSPGRYGWGAYASISNPWPTLDLGSNLATTIVSLSTSISNWDGSNMLIDWYDTANTGNYQLRLNFSLVNQSIEVRTPSTSLATYYLPVSDARWYWFSVKATIHNTTGSVLVRLGTTNIINLTNVNTRGTTSNNYANRISIGNSAWGGCAVDDVIICDTSGSWFNDIMNEKVIRMYAPSADGTYVNWIPNTGSAYQCVDETGAHNSDTDYILSNGPSSMQTVAITDATNADVINAVMVNQVSRKTSVYDRGVKTILRSGTTNYEGTECILTTSYKPFQNIYYYDPYTTGLWSQTTFNQIEAGVKLST